MTDFSNGIFYGFILGIFVSWLVIKLNEIERLKTKDYRTWQKKPIRSKRGEEL